MRNRYRVEWTHSAPAPHHAAVYGVALVVDRLRERGAPIVICNDILDAVKIAEALNAVPIADMVHDLVKHIAIEALRS